MADFIVYGQKLKYYHHVGLIFITICSICVSYEDIMKKNAEKAAAASAGVVAKSYPFPIWVPILASLTFPIATTYNSLVTKYITRDDIGFNATRITFTTHGIMNIMILSIGVPYWMHSNSFDPYLFKVGLGGGILNCLGLICCQNALS